MELSDIIGAAPGPKRHGQKKLINLGRCDFFRVISYNNKHYLQASDVSIGENTYDNSI